VKRPARAFRIGIQISGPRQANAFGRSQYGSSAVVSEEPSKNWRDWIVAISKTSACRRRRRCARPPSRSGGG